MVLVHGLLVILDSRRFLSVEISRWVGPCTMGVSRLTSWIEISRQVSRRLGNRHGKKQRYSPQKQPSSFLIIYPEITPHPTSKSASTGGINQAKVQRTCSISAVVRG